MIQFRFLGIPVRIEPMFWLVTFFLGGGLSLGAGTTKTDIIWVLMWMVIACVSILVHEYGHALTARKLSGGQHEIRLWGMGGLAYHQGGNPTRKSRLWTIAMGPGAGLALFLLTSLAVISTYGPEVLQYLVTRRVPTELSESFLSVVTTQPPLFRIFSMLIWINLWWSLINLLPVEKRFSPTKSALALAPQWPSLASFAENFISEFYSGSSLTKITRTYRTSKAPMAGVRSSLDASHLENGPA